MSGSVSAAHIGLGPVQQRTSGEILRDYRRRARIRQSELARQAGLSTRFVSEVERGIRQPSDAQADLLAIGIRWIAVDRWHAQHPALGRP